MAYVERIFYYFIIYTAIFFLWVQEPSTLLCPGAHDAVKMALLRNTFVAFSIFLYPCIAATLLLRLAKGFLDLVKT